MKYRRFGRTELRMPVLTCGGMRFQQSWKDLDVAEFSAESMANLRAILDHALESGINHLETARGYGCSEGQLGRLLPDYDRDSLIVQTKVAPQADGTAFREVFETSMSHLGLDRVDLLGLHGINNREILDLALKPGGSLEMAQQLRREGRCRFLGFSTHAPLEVILDAIRTDAFDYVNLHWYWVDPFNAPAIDAARQRDMGVFIISPNDKGGKLYAPSEKLVELCRPLTPMGFNALFCLGRRDVQTLSIGAARASDFDPHLEAVARLDEVGDLLPPIEARLRASAERVLGADWLEHWREGLPAVEAVPGNVNLYQVLRLYNLAKAYDLVDYARMRYNLFGNGGHWFTGNKVDQLDFAALPALLAEAPMGAVIPEVLREAHAMLNADDQKRLSQRG